MKSPPAFEMLLGRQNGKEQHLDGINVNSQNQSRRPLSTSGLLEVFFYFSIILKYCPKVHSFE